VKPVAGLNCGECHACQLSAAGTHGDFRWIQPEGKSRAIKIDQVRAAIEFTHQTAGFGQRKVIVLAPADNLNHFAFNALLKALEEPAQDTHILLLCHRLHGVPATIRSRCQKIPIKVPSVEASIAWLNEITGDSAVSARLLEVSENAPLLAQQLYEEDSADLAIERRLALRALLAGKVSVTQIWNLWGDVDSEVFLEQLASELRYAVRTSAEDQSRSERGKDLFRLLDEALRLLSAVRAGANPGKQLLCDSLLSKCHKLLAGSSAASAQVITS